MRLLYSFALFLLQPFLRVYLQWRIRRGKEDPKRLSERRGIASRVRPSGKLIWCHAASVGESLTLLPLIRAFHEENPVITILVTTGTLTSARLLEKRLGNHIIHQFVPLDVARWTKRFMRHWHPDLAIFIESELWPNLLHAAKQRKIPCVLLNARLSEKSFRKWKKLSLLSRKILRSFDLVLTQSETDSYRYMQLGAENIHAIGNLKFSMEKLPCDQNKMEEFYQNIAGRPVWLLASSHEGEEKIALDAHKLLLKDFPDILTVIVPRHLDRADQIEKQIHYENLSVARRTKDESFHNKNIYLADTMGELGVFFNAVPIVCVGASFVPKGGHNLIEPAQFGCALLYGPHMTASPDIRKFFESAGAGKEVRNAEELAAEIKYLLHNPDARAVKGDAARHAAGQQQNIVDHALYYLQPFFSAAGIVKEAP